MKRPIAISLSPNTQKDDVILAIKQLFRPIGWYDFTKTKRLENNFAEYFGKGYKALAVNSGRSALYLLLKAFGISYGDEVIVQALTCVAVPNAVLWTGAEPVYVDVGCDLNINPKDLAKKISKKTKAVIIQNSFGIPADYNSIRKIIRQKKKDIHIIEDCALALGAKYKNKKIGTLGDVSFFSFGRDKVISSVFGGMILTKNDRFYKYFKTERDKLEYPSPLWLIQQLLHPIIFSLVLPLYNLGLGKLSLGKAILFLSQKFKLVSKAVYREEEFSRRPKYFPAKVPASLSVLAHNQFIKLDKYNSHRKKIAEYYFKNLQKGKFKLPPNVPGSIWVRFPVVSEKTTDIYERLKGEGILLGNLYKDCVVPVHDLRMVTYVWGSCPEAESIKGKILNLPTYPGFEIKDAKHLISLISQ